MHSVFDAVYCLTHPDVLFCLTKIRFLSILVAIQSLHIQIRSDHLATPEEPQTEPLAGPSAPQQFVPRDARMARFLPSNIKLPSCWNAEMDGFICQCEALGDIKIEEMIYSLKQMYPHILGNVVIDPEAVDRRIQALELMDNDYFVAGMLAGVKRAEENGFELPSMDFDKYGKKEVTGSVS